MHEIYEFITDRENIIVMLVILMALCVIGAIVAVIGGLKSWMVNSDWAESPYNKSE